VTEKLKPLKSKVKVKAKLFVGLITHYESNMLVRFLTLAPDGYGQLQAPDALPARKELPPYPQYRKPVWPQRQSGNCEEEKNALPLAGN